ncbi:hypothetical protein DPMN_022737 [Dreissena polymorpha]|uniref:Uncharacterized protein n=1 Tax=Dreissena polymorpha TaxID=45954 RepID=A0A9D4NQJ6_DREPO|nr:hypothetical protein DPMN_022737 [Dreissena polymorpha]
MEFTHPGLHRRFSIGQWVFRDRPGWFCSIAGDVKVEQTIQRVSKGPGGHYVVEETRNSGAVAEFELLLHEIGSITSLLNLLTTNKPMDHTKCHLQHSMSATRRHSFNHNVEMLFYYVLECQNPYTVTVSVPVPLHNFLTKLAVDKEVDVRLLKCIENGEHVYRAYRQERIVEKAKIVSSTISKRKLPKFTDHLKQSLLTSKAILKERKAPSSKDMADAQRSMDIAKERGMSLKQILSHDVISSTPLFDGDLPAHVNKSKLIWEIESRLDISKWSRKSLFPTHVIVEFMSKMRQMPLAQSATVSTIRNHLLRAV